MNVVGQTLQWVVGLLVAGGLTFAAHAQAPAPDQPINYSAGKTAEQLFKSDCSTCHKNARGLAKSHGLILESFLRKHYTTSRETAALLAGYLATQVEPPKPAPPVRQASPRSGPAAPDAPSAPSFFSIFGAGPDKDKDKDKPAQTPPKPRRTAKPAQDAKPAGEASGPSGDKAKSDAAAKPKPSGETAKDADKPKDGDKSKESEKPKPAPAVESTGRSAAGEAAKTEKAGDGGAPSIAAPEKPEQKPGEAKSN